MDITNEPPPAKPTPAPLSNPPSTHRLMAGPPYETYEELEADIRAFARAAGFAVIKKRSNNYRNGKPTTITLACSKDTIRPSEGNNIRKSTTGKVGCIWECQAISRQTSNWLWEFRLRDGHDHHINHEAIQDPSASALLRSLTPEMKGIIESMSLNPGIRPRDIAATLHKQVPGACFTDKDIHNYRQQLRQKKLDGYTPTQALIRSFEQENILHFVYRDPEEENRITGCLWFEPWCIEMWRKYPGVISFDATYKTNKFKLPLFTGTVVTPTKTVANIVYGYINNETFEGFSQVIGDIERARIQLGIDSPGVIITNYDDAERGAIRLHMPSSKLQLCVFHINKNIVLNVKKQWKRRSDKESIPPTAINDEDLLEEDLLEEDLLEDDDVQHLNAPAKSLKEVPDLVPDEIPNTRTGLFELWKHMVYARTEDKFHATWERLKKQFNDQQGIITYINREYMATKQEWAACYTSANKNYGQRTTSPTETTHRDLKTYLVHGRGDLLKVRSAIQEMIIKQQRKASTAESLQVERLRRQYIGARWLGDLPRKVSYVCVDLLSRQHRKALGALTTKSTLGPCTDLITEQYGIPCAHDLIPKLEAGEAIGQEEIDKYWWLGRDLADEHPYLRIQDPNVITNTRGRPRNHGPFGEDPPTLTQQTWSIQASQQKQLGRSRDTHPTSSSVRRQLSQWEHGESLQQLDTADTAPSATPAPAKRGRGRPPGSKNKPKPTNPEPTIPAKRTFSAFSEGRRDGRPVRRTINGLRNVVEEEEEEEFD